MPSFNFFLGVVSEIEVQSFFRFSNWLPHHVAYDIIIIIKTFYMSSCTNGENFVSIRQAVAVKNTKVLCGQTNTNKQTDRQTNGPNCNTLTEEYKFYTLQIFMNTVHMPWTSAIDNKNTVEDKSTFHGILLDEWLSRSKWAVQLVLRTDSCNVQDPPW